MKTADSEIFKTNQNLVGIINEQRYFRIKNLFVGKIARCMKNEDEECLARRILKYFKFDRSCICNI